jgi:tRNA 2-thiouridine synthesizing protein E
MAQAIRNEAVQFDEDGFIQDPLRWNESLAARIAEGDGLGPLGKDQWDVIHALHDEYFRFGALPGMRQICRKAHKDYHAVERLFTVGGPREACRIAGIPNPGEEVKAYL